ncbi:MAG: biliverdin-producing heme oxygenase [Verrucomicrobiota bacterium JB022]|nr:biliverdin-producing heme oxygenase [Verrucomicrobiota bacterium JB022]
MPSSSVKLSAALRTLTAESHRAAERSPFVRRLIRGPLSLPAYIFYLRELQVAYQALESALRTHSAHPALTQFVRPELFRAVALAEDIEQLTDVSDGEQPVESLPYAGQHYARHLEEIAAETPAALLAHLYVRYLGDMSGGQMIGQAIQRQFELPDEVGLNFYNFADIPDLDAYKEQFRNWIDETPLTENERSLVLEEAVRGFDLSNAIFDEAERLGVE